MSATWAISNLTAKAAPFIERERLWPERPRLVAAVSGGADSLCLLGILLDLRDNNHPRAPSEIIVAHLDHGLRGAAGAADAIYVGELAASLHLPFFTERADVRALARAQHRSLEDAARRARYVFLRRVAAQSAAACICTGHTADDQVETIIMHWLRGSGLRGLSGMAARTDDLARPLLTITHAEAVMYCAERGWEPRHDETNDDLIYQRNRVRHELLPALERYNPNLRQTLLRNAILLAGDEAYLECETDRAFEEVCMSQESNAVILSLAALRELPQALLRRVLRRAVSRFFAKQDEQQDHMLEAKHLFEIEYLLTDNHAGARLSLPGNLVAERVYETLVISYQADNGQQPELADEVLLPVPGECVLPALGWRLHATLEEKPAGSAQQMIADRAARDAELSGTRHHAAYPIEATVYLDADASSSGLLVRTWRPGDRFRPLGMQYEKKLHDYFTDAKVPRDLRHRIPLVYNARHLVWIAGLRIDDRVRLTPETRRILVLQLEPL
jgi:tRNA(Ile)-lysidine synthase